MAKRFCRCTGRTTISSSSLVKRERSACRTRAHEARPGSTRVWKWRPGMLHRRLLRTLVAFVTIAGAAHAQTDDRYRFAAGQSEEQAVALERTPEGVRFVWRRPTTADWDTALLSVRSAGAEAAPRVEIAAGNARIEQHFEANSHGLRWLNLTSVRDQLTDGTPVTIRTYGITLEPGAA